MSGECAIANDIAPVTPANARGSAAATSYCFDRYTQRLIKCASVTLCSIALLLSPQLGSAAEIDASSFRCLTKMTPVRGFYVDNLRGDLAATLAPPIQQRARSIRPDPWCN
jgi:hypothetical protein